MASMGLKIYAGKTFHLPTPPSNIPHLFIVVSPPDFIVNSLNQLVESVVVVNFTTKKSGKDDTVVLMPQDHRFIRHETVVSYRDARFVEVSRICDYITQGTSRFDDDCSDDLLEKIQDGLLVSPFTPNKVKKYYRSILDI
jgi:hypothetical protein